MPASKHDAGVRSYSKYLLFFRQNPSSTDKKVLFLNDGGVLFSIKIEDKSLKKLIA